jgi:hypothetical protein
MNKAVRENDLITVKKLIKCGVDPNDPITNGGYTPLHVICDIGIKNYLPMAKFLLKNGADIDKKSTNGLSPLLTAISKNNKVFIKFLLIYRADRNIKDDSGNNAFMYAVYTNNYDLVYMYLQNGQDPNFKNNDGNTPLVHAIGNCYVNIAKILIWYGATQPKHGLKKCLKDEVCSICLNGLYLGKICGNSGCEHIFHCECISQWLNLGKRSCPYCRKPFNSFSTIVMSL